MRRLVGCPRARFHCREGSPLMSTSASRAAAALFGLVLTVGCGPEPERAAAGLPPPVDPAALAEVRDRFARSGDFDAGSVTTLRALLQQDPGDESVTTLLQHALLQRQDWNGLAELLQARAGTDEQRMELASVLVKAQRLDEAASLLAVLLAERPDAERVIWLSAYTAYQRGRHDEAAALLDDSLERLLAAGRNDALLLLGTLRLADDPERSRDLLTAYVARDSQNPAGHSALGRALAALGDEAGAREHLERAVALHDGMGRAESEQLKLSAQASALNRAFEAGEHDRCVELLDEMLAHAQPELQVELYRFLARVHLARGRSDLADAALERAAQLGVVVR